MTTVITLQSSREVVNLVVGGNNFCFSKEELERFPDSYFAPFLKAEWRYDKSDDIYIDRDGWLFRFVFTYIVSDSFVFRTTTVSLDALLAIRREADFYNLPGMTALCDKRIAEQLIDWCKHVEPCLLGKFTCESEYSMPPAPLFCALNEAVRPTFADKNSSEFELPLPNFGLETLSVPRISQSYNGFVGLPTTARRKRCRVRTPLFSIPLVATASNACLCFPLLPTYSRDVCCTYRVRVCTLVVRSPHWDVDRT